jgi:dephospho-CoA kinase
VIPFIGLTGGIGAGKSTALEALERLGAAVVSTDGLVHELYETDEVKRAVVDRFGSDVAPDGAVDRALLAERAFAAPAQRAWLESLLWPLVAERMVAWRRGLDRADPSPRAAVVEVPLLFEAEMDDAFDATIAIVAEEDLRAARASSRGHAALDERSARQLTQEQKAERAGYVVVNDGTEGELQSKLSAILDKLQR